MTKKQKEIELPVTIQPADVGFLKYFIYSYFNNFKSGKVDNAHHDATAIVLHLRILLNIPEELIKI
jgi:hypothetical protein